jgi:hypothetical protein
MAITLIYNCLCKITDSLLDSGGIIGGKWGYFDLGLVLRLLDIYGYSDHKMSRHRVAALAKGITIVRVLRLVTKYLVIAVSANIK